MGRLLFKQPNGLYGRWSGMCDAITHWNMTKEEYIEYSLNCLKEELEEKFEQGYYEKYDLDYIIDNEGFSLCWRALAEGDFETDVYQAIKSMGASEEQLEKILKIKERAESIFNKERKERITEDEEDGDDNIN